MANVADMMAHSGQRIGKKNKKFCRIRLLPFTWTRPNVVNEL
jgi:hypothetical protein